MVEGRLKGMMEEADKDKALKQVAEVSLNKKTLELNSVECQPITTEKARELAEQKAKDLQGSSGRPKSTLSRSLATSLPGTKNLPT